MLISTQEAMLPLLREEVDAFATRYDLTSREHEVLALLVEGICAVSAIAEQMRLSANTVHNHFKKLFRRTATHNKSALMSLFIRECLDRQAQHHTFLKWPNVLLVGADDQDRGRLRGDLGERGMRVFEASNGDDALSAVAKLGIDVVVASSADAVTNGDLRARIVNRFGRRPSVLVAEDLPAVAPWPDAIGGDGSAMNDALVFSILQSFIDSPYERSRLLRVQTHLTARLGDRLQATIANLGFGGAFAAVPREVLERNPQLGPGAPLTVEIMLGNEAADQAAIRGEARVAWRRELTRRCLPSGLGLRFERMAEAGRHTLETFVRRRKLAQLSTLPLAPRPTAEPARVRETEDDSGGPARV